MKVHRRPQLGYDSLPALRSYRGAALSVLTRLNDAPLVLLSFYSSR
jgi:hypothetical protein